MTEYSPMTEEEIQRVPYNEFLRGLNAGKVEAEILRQRYSLAEIDAQNWKETLADRQHRRENTTERVTVGAVLLAIVLCLGIMAKCSSTFLPAGCYQIGEEVSAPTQNVKGIPCPAK